MMVTINCIYDKDASKIRRYLKEAEFDECVNYMDIFNKLTKNDMYSKEPSDEVLGTFVFKQLERVIQEKNAKNIFYVLSSLDTEVIDNIKNTVIEMSMEEVTMNLYSFREQESLIGIDEVFLIDEAENI